MGKIIIKKNWRWKNRTKFRKCIIRRKLEYFRSTIDVSRSRTRRIQHQPWNMKPFISWIKKTFWPKMCMIHCILLALLVLLCMVLFKSFSSDTFPKLRPIASSIGTFNYNIVHFLYILSPFLVSKHYSSKDTLSFVSQIKNANLSGMFLVSYNVTSLFTNISLQETIDIAINLIFNHNPNLNVNKIKL